VGGGEAVGTSNPLPWGSIPFVDLASELRVQLLLGSVAVGQHLGVSGVEHLHNRGVVVVDHSAKVSITREQGAVCAQVLEHLEHLLVFVHLRIWFFVLCWPHPRGDYLYYKKPESGENYFHNS